MTEINKPSTLDGSELWASTGTVSAPTLTKYNIGWVVEAPPYQNFNYVLNKFDVAFAHLNQHGGMVWDSSTEYQGTKSWTLGTNGTWYYCKTTNINQNPVTDISETYWRPVLDGNKKLNASSVSSYMLTVLDDTSSSAAQTSLGGTTTGKALFTAASAAAARSTLGIVQATETVSGISEISTDAELLAGTLDTVVVTPKKIRLGFDISLSTSLGYIKFPSWMLGFTIAWGRTQVAPTSTSVLDLSSIFGANILNTTCSDNNVTTTVDIPSPRCSASGANLTLVNPYSVAMNINWKAFGN